MSAVASRVVRLHEYGEPLDVLHEEQIEVAEPPEHRVRVKVIAVGLNPADWELCRGFMPARLPRGIGFDVAGVVDAVGIGVEGVEVGDVVVGFADFLAQPSAGVADVAILQSWVPVPEGLDPVQAAVLPMAVQTAAWTLDAMGVHPGSTVLVHGAGSMVGFAAVQIARREGAQVIATAGPTYAAELAGFGAAVTAYGDGMVARVRALAEGPVEHVLDTPPSHEGTLPALIEIAGNPDRVVTISNHEEARRLGARVNLDIISEPTPFEQLLPPYVTLAAAGQFRIPIAHTYPLDAWRDAVELSTSGRPRGKIVLLP